ncbi:MAG: flagellar biosynthetic protein FliO [Anaerovoracaceae bacterium]
MPDYIGNIISMIFALIGIILIIGLTYFAAKWYGGRMGPIGKGRHIKVVERLQVSRNGAIVIIEVKGKQYIVGVSDQNIGIMAEIEEPITYHEEKDFGEGSLKDLFSMDRYKGFTDAMKRRKGGKE